MKNPWLNKGLLMNEAGDGSGGGGAASGSGDANGGGNAAAGAGGDANGSQQQQSQQSQLGYQDVTNQNGAGYDENKPKEDKPAESKFKFDREGHDDKSASLVEKFAELHGLSEKQVEGFAGFIKNMKQNAEAAKTAAAEASKKESFANMQKDLATLKAHPEFGKNLEQSFMESNKVLDLMPDVKKMLTEGGKHIDARIMIGLKGLYSKLYGQDGTLVQGGKPEQESNLPVWDQIYGVREK